VESLAKPVEQSWLSWFAKGLLALTFIVIIGRLFELQIIKGGYFRSLAEENRVRKIPIMAPRGKVLARGGEEIISNKEVKNQGIDETNLVDFITEWERIYSLGSALAHVTGYLGEVNEKEVGKVNPGCLEKGPYRLGSLIGRGGLEEYYECTLRGIDGEELVEVDTFGQKVRVLGRRKPVPGEDIQTTIDYNLQKKVVEVMGSEIKVGKERVIPANKLGAVVATDTRGEVLAFYSSPSFDPNLFMDKSENSQKTLANLLQDKKLPFFNRVISGSYHPGSLFKIVTATAALEEGKINEDFRYTDMGFISVGDFSYKNWYFTQYGGVEGEIDLVKAIARSTDTFFYKLGELVGAESLASWAKKLGLGKKVGIDLPSEKEGLVPTPDWKEKTKGERWFLGNTYHMAIGQGDVEVTPLQANMLTLFIASKGLLCKAHLIKTNEGECTELKVKKETFDLVKEGMVGACSPGGTAFPFFDFKPQVACKTGTAETGTKENSHAWFTVFAPVDEPKIVVTVFVENGGEGSYVAAPIAKEILKYYFQSN